jgi:EAL domain-containing protein (putative c-di-GMP-specific phosphodiesterase class I)
MEFSDADKRKLRDALSARTPLHGNLMTFIGLDEVRERFPEVWERQRERITETSRAILRQFTDPRTDIVLPIGDEKFAVLFTRLDKTEAMLRAGIIKAEILRRFVGDESLEHLDIRTDALDIDSGDETTGVLRDLLDGAGAGRAQPAAAAPARSRQRQRAYRASIEEIGADWSMPIDEIEQTFGFDLDSLEFAFQPHLYARRGVFSIFECRAVRYDATGAILSGYDVLPRDCTPGQITAVDKMTLMRARHGLVDMAFRKRIAVVATPVSFETMSTRATATEFLDLLRKIPSDLRNYLVVDICRAPVGVPEGRLAEIISPIKQLTRAVFVRVSSAQQSLATLKGAGAFGAGLNMPSRAGRDLGSPGFLGRFAASARKLRLQTYALDVDTQQQVASCREAGMDYMAGRALAELSDYVGPVTGMQSA